MFLLLQGKTNQQTRDNITDDAITEEFKNSNSANNIYTYDDYGILIYQKHNTNTISSLSINFIRQKYDFSPYNSFSGKLIAGKTVDIRSDEEKLKKIKGLVLDLPMFFYQKEGFYRLLCNKNYCVIHSGTNIKSGFRNYQ